MSSGPASQKKPILFTFLTTASSTSPSKGLKTSASYSTSKVANAVVGWMMPCAARNARAATGGVRSRYGRAPAPSLEDDATRPRLRTGLRARRIVV